MFYDGGYVGGMHRILVGDELTRHLSHPGGSIRSLVFH